MASPEHKCNTDPEGSIKVWPKHKHGVILAFFNKGPDEHFNQKAPGSDVMLKKGFARHWQHAVHQPVSVCSWGIVYQKG